jgi:hypothetical protein
MFAVVKSVLKVLGKSGGQGKQADICDSYDYCVTSSGKSARKTGYKTY